MAVAALYLVMKNRHITEAQTSRNRFRTAQGICHGFPDPCRGQPFLVPPGRCCFAQTRLLPLPFGHRLSKRDALFPATTLAGDFAFPNNISADIDLLRENARHYFSGQGDL